ncbi:MAG TPA: class I SAM-dependent methyltransferase [Elusimicrobiales bacterium]|nr:class I SAM-dependent methyltransferase [Elusimicrobiales bacterium]
MKDLAAIYAPSFFREWGPSNHAYVDSAKTITDAIFAQFRPRRLADLGCGTGVYSSLFAAKGAAVLALDGVLPPAEHSFPVEIEVRDLTEPFENSWGAFDLALCLEVAEHIPEDLLPAFLKNITAFSDTLLLSAAPPNQGGHHHVNEQPRRYWVRRLKDHGFAYDRPATGLLCEKLKRIGLPNMWMGLHICVYRRAKDPRELSHGLPFDVSLRA